MSKENLIRRFLSKLTPEPKQTKAPEVDPLIPAMIKMLCQTHEEELSCDEVLEIIDEYAELKAKGANVEKLYPLIRIHMDRCHDCLEEYDALLRVIEAD